MAARNWGQYPAGLMTSGFERMLMEGSTSMVADIRRVGRAAAFCAAVWTAAAQTQHLPHGWLWRDPGDVAALDFGGTVGAPVHLPKPPFRFVREDPRGTQPKVFVRDAEGATWNVKFGYEVHPESFCWRLVR